MNMLDWSKNFLRQLVAIALIAPIPLATLNWLGFISMSWWFVFAPWIIGASLWAVGTGLALIKWWSEE